MNFKKLRYYKDYYLRGIKIYLWKLYIKLLVKLHL